MTREEALQVLGFQPFDAPDLKAINDAFRNKAKETHADLTGHGDNSAFHRISEAKELLSLGLTAKEEMHPLTKEAMAVLKGMNHEIVSLLLAAKQINRVKFQQFQQAQAQSQFRVGMNQFAFQSEEPADYVSEVILPKLNKQVADEVSKLQNYKDSLELSAIIREGLSQRPQSLYMDSLIAAFDPNTQQILSMKESAERHIVILQEALRIVYEFCAANNRQVTAPIQQVGTYS